MSTFLKSKEEDEEEFKNRSEPISEGDALLDKLRQIQADRYSQENYKLMEDIKPQYYEMQSSKQPINNKIQDISENVTDSIHRKNFDEKLRFIDSYLKDRDKKYNRSK